MVLHRASWVVVFAAACGGARPAGVTEASSSRGAAEHAGLVSGAGAGLAEHDCAGWSTWTQVNARRFPSRGHGGGWVDVFVEPPFVAAYRARRAPVGMRVVKAGHKTADGAVQALTVMGKMPPGYDPAHGDWYYGVLDPDGRTATMQGKLESCIACHVQVRDHDYLFGVDGR
jgi:hypothetical protein